MAEELSRWEEILSGGLESLQGLGPIPPLLLGELVGLYQPPAIIVVDTESKDDKEVEKMSQYLLHELWPANVQLQVWAQVRKLSRPEYTLANADYEAKESEMRQLNIEIDNEKRLVNMPDPFGSGIGEEEKLSRLASMVWRTGFDASTITAERIRGAPTKLGQLELKRSGFPTLVPITTFFPKYFAQAKTDLLAFTDEILLGATNYNYFLQAYITDKGQSERKLEYVAQARRSIRDMQLGESYDRAFKAETINHGTIVYIPGIAKTCVESHGVGYVGVFDVCLADPERDVWAARALVNHICEREGSKGILAVNTKPTFGLEKHFAWYNHQEIITPAGFLLLEPRMDKCVFTFPAQNATWKLDTYGHQFVGSDLVREAVATFQYGTRIVVVKGLLDKHDVCSVQIHFGGEEIKRIGGEEIRHIDGEEIKRIHSTILDLGVLHLLLCRPSEVSGAQRVQDGVLVIANGVFAPEDWGGVQPASNGAPSGAGPAGPAGPVAKGSTKGSTKGLTAGTPADARMYTIEAIRASAKYKELLRRVPALFGWVQSMLESSPDSFKEEVAALMLGSAT